MKIVLWMEEPLGGRKGLVLDSNSGGFELHSAGEDLLISKLKIIPTIKENLLSFVYKATFEARLFYVLECCIFSEMPWSALMRVSAHARAHTHTHTHTHTHNPRRMIEFRVKIILELLLLLKVH